jgi:hypothetical protein
VHFFYFVENVIKITLKETKINVSYCLGWILKEIFIITLFSKTKKKPKNNREREFIRALLFLLLFENASQCHTQAVLIDGENRFFYYYFFSILLTVYK